MKTITEYRPLIFGEPIAQSVKRRSHLRKMTWNGLAVAGYCAFGLWLFMSIGFAPWNWQFWIVFGPIFVAGELVARELSRPPSARKESFYFEDAPREGFQNFEEIPLEGVMRCSRLSEKSVRSAL